jgi:hypothetical protein
MDRALDKYTIKIVHTFNNNVHIGGITCELPKRHLCKAMIITSKYYILWSLMLLDSGLNHTTMLNLGGGNEIQVQIKTPTHWDWGSVKHGLSSRTNKLSATFSHIYIYIV